MDRSELTIRQVTEDELKDGKGSRYKALYQALRELHKRGSGGLWIRLFADRGKPRKKEKGRLLSPIRRWCRENNVGFSTAEIEDAGEPYLQVTLGPQIRT